MKSRKTIIICFAAILAIAAISISCREAHTAISSNESKNAVSGYEAIDSSLVPEQDGSTQCYGINDPWDAFKKTTGVLIVKDKSVILEPSNKEKNDFTNSFNPVTGIPAKELKNKDAKDKIKGLNIQNNSTGDLNTITIQFALDG